MYVCELCVSVVTDGSEREKREKEKEREAGLTVYTVHLCPNQYLDC